MSVSQILSMNAHVSLYLNLSYKHIITSAIHNITQTNNNTRFVCGSSKNSHEVHERTKSLSKNFQVLHHIAWGDFSAINISNFHLFRQKSQNRLHGLEAKSVSMAIWGALCAIVASHVLPFIHLIWRHYAEQQENR